MQNAPNPESTCLALFEQYGLDRLVKSITPGCWQPIWLRLEELVKTHPFHDSSEKQVFIDLFFTHCLSRVSAQKTGSDLWGLVEKWFEIRNPPPKSASLSRDEQSATVLFTLKLRDKIRDWLLAVECSHLELLGEPYQQVMLRLWKQVFLESFSPINMLWKEEAPSQNLNTALRLKDHGWPGLLAASMYYPLDAEEFDVDCDALLESILPLHCKNILICWLTNIPYFNGHMKHRDRLCLYVPRLCSAFIKRPAILGLPYFVGIVQEIMTGFWRASYIGGNNAAALSAFGDFISAMINRFCPNLPQPAVRTRKPGERIRIGYISRNFFRQAVSYYMINRILHHDRDKFEVFAFSLGDYQDAFTEMYVKHCDHYEKFTDLKNFGAIINGVIQSQLDILIFTDIGMDAVTYILSGLRLAPVQCAMVGHGTTTGMPTIDYYISGDFEAPSAQDQYREKLVRLPNLGAAQFLPDPPVPGITRSDLGIPDDAVLFISCANGIKHRPERELLYIEILKQAPNAWLLLKPFTSQDSLDGRLSKRLKERAASAGVADRLLIIPAIGHYRSVLGLLGISDVQLDTYPYGGWTTNMEALYSGLPLVTQEGELSRSRWGAGMLRALGIQEGIATNEEEFVAWAARFARDPQLRWQVSQTIKSRVVDVLFNGPAAQPAFERAILDILRSDDETTAPSASPPPAIAQLPLLKQLGTVSILLPKNVYVATSIAPRDYPAQRAALASWQKAGFRILSLNPQEELARLTAEFPDIEFFPSPRDARERYGKPYVYFDDILACLAGTGAPVGGIINSDIHLIDPRLYELAVELPTGSTMFGSRFEADSPDAKMGKLYDLGFDFFFFRREALSAFPPEQFCLGLPWWDYWAGIYPIDHHIPSFRVVTPAALHLPHPAGWNWDSWLSLGQALAHYYPPPFALNQETMPHYTRLIARRINQEARDVRL